MILRLNKEAIVHYILIYFCFLNTSSQAANMFGDTFIIITMICCVGLIALRVIQFERKYGIYIITLFLFIVFQHVLLQRDISIQSVMNTLSKFMIAYCAVSYNKEKFISRFVNTTVFFASCSIICYCISLTPAESILRLLLIPNDARNWTGVTSYGRFFYHHMVGYGRNVGIFREPGVFQLYLNLVLFVMLFMDDSLQRHKKMKIVIIAIAIITTLSTAGYLSALIILGGYVFHNKNGWSGRKVTVVVVGIMALCIFIQTPLFQEVFIRKMAFSNGSFEQGTGNARLASIQIDLQRIINNVWGYGNSNTWVNTSTIASQEIGSSVGLTTVIACYGIPISSILYVGFIYAFRRATQTKIAFVTLLATFVSAFLSQPWVLSPVYLMIMAYGFLRNDADETYEKMMKFSYNAGVEELRR